MNTFPMIKLRSSSHAVDCVLARRLSNVCFVSGNETNVVHERSVHVLLVLLALASSEGSGESALPVLVTKRKIQTILKLTLSAQLGMRIHMREVPIVHGLAHNID